MAMWSYLGKRVFLGVVSVWVLFTATFFLMRSVPGDPLVRTRALPAHIQKNLNEKYGLNKPVWQQYTIQLSEAVRGNLGVSFRVLGREVNDIIKTHFPVSAYLGLFSVGVGTVVGLVLGSIAAFYRQKAPDRMVMLVCVLGMALPSFLFAYLFQFGLAVLPITKWGVDPQNWVRPTGWGQWRDYLLPGMTLSLGVVAQVTRMMRGQMVEVAQAEFTKTARAKGASPLRVVWVHQVRNAILPVVSLLGPVLVYIMGGSLVIEQIFGIPGLGLAYVSSIQSADYNVIMGLTIFYGTFFILMNLLTDVVYGLLDPRIRVGG